MNDLGLNKIIRKELGFPEDGHIYLSTSCFHELHEYCESMVGYQGEKRPAKCKFCEARCICQCHVKGKYGRREALRN